MQIIRKSCALLLGTIVVASGQTDGRKDGPGSRKGPRPSKESSEKGRERGAQHGKRHGFVANRFMESYDTSKDGAVSYQEFAAAKRTASLPEEGKKRLFDRLDKNSDGFIRPDELPSGGGPPPNVNPKRGDLDGDGKISFQEFTKSPRLNGVKPERLKGLFDRIDHNKDGFLTEKDFRRPRGHGGMERAEMEKLDTNGDKALSFEEWSKNPRHKDLSPEELKKRFQRLDRNDDGQLNEKDHRRGPGPGPGGRRPSPRE